MVIDEQEIDSPVSDIIRRSEEKLRTHISKAVDITSKDLELRTEEYPF